MSGLVRPITPDEVAAYHSAGVVLLRSVLDLKTVNALRRCIDQAVATLDQSKNGYDFAQLTHAYEAGDVRTLSEHDDGQHNVSAILDHVRASGERILVDPVSGDRKGSFYGDTGVAARIKDFRRLVTRGALTEIAAGLLGSNTVRFYDDQIFVKEPCTAGRTAYHQDAPYLNIDGYDCCVLWVPVDPVSLEHGAMRYLRATHRNPTTYAANVFVARTPLPGSEGDMLPDIEANEGDYDIVHFDVEPGDVLVHNYKLIHGTGGNTSRYQVRRAASITYVGDDIRFRTRPGAPRRDHHRHDLGNGDPLTGPSFPIVWQRKVVPDAA